MGQSADMKNEVYFMQQVLKSTELNFEKLSLNKEYFTSYQQAFFKKLKVLMNELKETKVLNKRMDDTMNLWNLIDNFDSIGRRKIIFFLLFLGEKLDF